MFNFTEKSLDQIAFFIENRIEVAPCRRCAAAWDHGLCPRGGNGINGALSIIAFIRQNMIGFQAIKQRFDLCDVVTLAACEDEADGIAKCISGRVDFGTQTTF